MQNKNEYGAAGELLATRANSISQRSTSPRLLKIREAAAMIGVSPASVRRLIERGLLRSNRSLRHHLIPVAELDRFVRGEVSQ
jgi:excisionase family DNA binding protein